jgi:ferredoxin
VIAAPKLFSFAADGSLKYVEQPDEALRDDALDAEDVCPEQAISIQD